MTFPLKLDVKSEVVFDEIRQNRFLLRRVWKDRLPRMGVCMLNPSVAAEDVDDPTVRKVQAYARNWGFGSVEVVNLFSWRATNPKELPKREESRDVKHRNIQVIAESAIRCDLFLCAWGRNGRLESRDDEVIDRLRIRKDLYAFRLLADGVPEHPLYLPLKLAPVEFEAANKNACA